jgi:hypothetical protein
MWVATTNCGLWIQTKGELPQPTVGCEYRRKGTEVSERKLCFEIVNKQGYNSVSGLRHVLDVLENIKWKFEPKKKMQTKEKSFEWGRHKTGSSGLNASDYKSKNVKLYINKWTAAAWTASGVKSI